MKLIYAINYWESDDGKRQVLKDCIESLKGKYQLLILAGKQPTLPIAWNMCLELGFSMGADYVIVSNDDVILTDGTVDMLCKKDTVVSPLINGGDWKIFHAHVFCIPRSVYEKVGKMDERYQLYWCDTDYAKTLVDAGIPVEINHDVDFSHPSPARTLKHFAGITERSDEELFFEKWGRTYFDPVRGT